MRVLTNPFKPPWVQACMLLTSYIATCLYYAEMSLHCVDTNYWMLVFSMNILNDEFIIMFYTQLLNL